MKVLKLLGRTEDGKDAIGGLFTMYDTHGIPFEISFQLCDEKNQMPSWIDIYDEAIKAGWDGEKILGKLSNAIVDIWGVEFRDVVIERLKRYR